MNLVASVLGAAERAPLAATLAGDPILEQVFDAEFRFWRRRRRLLFMTIAELLGRGSGSERGVIPSALEKDRWYPRRPARRRLTPAGALASDESEARANGISHCLLASAAD